MTGSEDKPVRVFISYRHTDHRIVGELRNCLGWLENSDRVIVFDDRQILAGDEWDVLIRGELDRADVIILVITAAFMRSPYCTRTELREGLRLRSGRGVRVIPIIAEAVDFEAMPFQGIAVLPKDQANNLKPLRRWGRDRDVALAQVAQHVRQNVEKIRAERLLQATDKSRTNADETPSTPIADSGRSGATPFRLSPSFNSGLYGGLIGGALAGLLIGVAYFVQFSSLDESVTWLVIPENVAYASFGGLVLGAFTMLIISWFRYLATERDYPLLVINDVTGGLLGGAVSGFFIGGLAGLTFGLLHKYYAGMIPLVTGSVLGAIFVAAGALFYDYRGSWRNVMRAFVASLLFTACTVTGGIMLLQHLDIAHWVSYETTGDLNFMTEGGAILGAVIGMVSGGQIGLTLSLYRLWEAAEN